MGKKQITLTQAKLILEDGSEFEGWAFGKMKSAAGEVVFNTGMSGLVQALTDPACKGQIFVGTWPIAGNCGVHVNKNGAPFFDRQGIPETLESENIQISGLVVSDLCEEPGHYSAKLSLSAWLEKGNTPGIYGIDTRAIAIRLRERGTMRGKILIEGKKDVSLKKIDMSNHNGVSLPAAKFPAHNEIKTYVPFFDNAGESESGAGSREKPVKIKIAIVDCGLKANVIRCLLNRKAEVVRIPCYMDFNNIDYDGLLISGGPGDPKDYKKLIETARKALSENKPVFGIGLGCLVMALAAGADTCKLPFGHRSQNQPCIECGTASCYVTAQNHGWSVRVETLPEGWKQWFTNANDGTIEGIKCESKPYSGVLFYPEGCPGSRDTEFIFDRFIAQVKEGKK